jgi:hypothetical protein
VNIYEYKTSLVKDEEIYLCGFYRAIGGGFIIFVPLIHEIRPKVGTNVPTICETYDREQLS